MSWLIGWLSESLPPDAELVLASIHPKSKFTIVTQNLCLAAGGPTETLRSSALNDQTAGTGSGWLVCGLGIQTSDDHCRFLEDSDWHSEMSQPGVPDFNKHDGHFIACRWHGRLLEVYADQLGLRTMYSARNDKGVYFSSRLDWVAQLSGESSIDFGNLGPRWLSFNQLSQESEVLNVRRLGPGGNGRVFPDSIEFRGTPWSPEFSPGFEESAFRSHLAALAFPALRDGRRVSLGLSGGLDSRALLAVSLHERSSVNVHTFGNPRDPDVHIARKIAAGEDLSQTLFLDPIPAMDECIALMTGYASQAHLTEPATSIIRLRFYDRLNARNKVMMDGGFGELFRRQYLNRLLFKGKSALESQNAEGIAPFLRAHRAGIFTREINIQMERGIVRQLREVLDAMPPISSIGPGNFLDLFSLRTRVPNWGSPEQARLDGLVVNYMPFVQPSLLRKGFSIPARNRKNGLLFRNLIRDLRPSLSHYPLAKSGTTYPFSLGTVQSWLWTKFKKRIGLRFQDTLQHEVLMRVKPFVQDLVESSSVRTYGAYDYGELAQIVGQFYRGAPHLAGEVDWWIAFELWRRSVGAK